MSGGWAISLWSLSLLESKLWQVKFNFLFGTCKSVWVRLSVVAHALGNYVNYILPYSYIYSRDMRLKVQMIHTHDVHLHLYHEHCLSGWENDICGKGITVQTRSIL